MALCYTSRRAALSAALLVFAILLVLTELRSFSVLRQQKGHPQELLVVHDFLPGVVEPQHCDLINMTKSLQMRQDILMPIDQVHLEGLVHSGTWIFVLDSDHRLLAMKRGPQLVTCPNQWSLVGEHTLGREEAIQTVRRGIREELGASVLQHARFIRPLTELPVYYFRDYGPANGNRIDRQVTGLWWIQLDCKGSHVKLQLDDEVADHQWISIEEFEEWIRDEPKAMQEGRQGKLCHETIVSLSTLGVKALKETIQKGGE
jgi:isopentenyldiphosphate isomerase